MAYKFKIAMPLTALRCLRIPALLFCHPGYISPDGQARLLVIPVGGPAIGHAADERTGRRSSWPLVTSQLASYMKNYITGMEIANRTEHQAALSSKPLLAYALWVGR